MNQTQRGVSYAEWSGVTWSHDMELFIMFAPFCMCSTWPSISLCSVLLFYACLFCIDIVPHLFAPLCDSAAVAFEFTQHGINKVLYYLISSNLLQKILTFPQK